MEAVRCSRLQLLGREPKKTGSKDAIAFGLRGVGRELLQQTPSPPQRMAPSRGHRKEPGCGLVVALVCGRFLVRPGQAHDLGLAYPGSDVHGVGDDPEPGRGLDLARVGLDLASSVLSSVSTAWV